VLPSPADEVVGVFHMKAFVCDEELLVSGANLEQSYFADRQDRYVHFGAAGDLARYYHHLVNVLGGTGARVTANGSAPGAVAVTSANLSVEEWSRRLEECTQPWQPAAAPSSSADTWVFPTLQCAPLGIRQDQEATAALLRAVPDTSTVNFCTAYLNPPPPLVHALAAAAPQGAVTVLSAHPESHGFRGARGVMAYVSRCYEYLLVRRVLPALRAARPSALRVLAYRRANWTYHAKGIWIFPNAHAADTGGAVTVVGSSNFGRRSSELDLECQMTILTEDPALCALLKEEWRWLEERCPAPLDLSLDRGAAATTCTLGVVPVLAKLMGRFL
jgi:CDP-diacylglycerol--glycerol-3-phosphate 3-phosphatidyltransferase